MTLTKADMAQKIADDCGFLKGEATEVFENLLAIMKKSLIAGEDVMISGFGKWQVGLNDPVKAGIPKAGSRYSSTREES